MEDVAAFPLCWPVGWRRTEPARRKEGSFGDRSVYDNVTEIREVLRKMGATEVIVSTSIPLRKDGIPLARPPVDGDPGVAVYFQRKKRAQCIAIDSYRAVDHNLRAVHNTLEAMRTIERHGGAEILDRAFTGFAQLPQSTTRNWWEVLEVSKSATESQVEAAYRRLTLVRHPDVGGTHEAMAELNLARDEWRASL